MPIGQRPKQSHLRSTTLPGWTLPGEARVAPEHELRNADRQDVGDCLTGSEGGEQGMEAEAHHADGDEQEQEEQEQEDHDDEEELLDADSDEEQVQTNESANEKFPLAHRLLDEMGFKNNSLLERVLSSSNAISFVIGTAVINTHMRSPASSRSKRAWV